ncbi:ABC transporter substrate-binding protein [Albidovulum sp.]|uniref:ABC transporter substrate-binding protein n=1 Tax=Albidovulum sp. TaxID=1872424 RepID=UPI0039B8DC24
MHMTGLRSALASRAMPLAAAVLAGATLLSSGAAALTPESSDPIKIAQHDWAGSEFSTQLTVRLLREAGYNAEAVTIDASSVYTALENGDITFQVESWTTSHPELPPLLEAGRMTNVGETGLIGMDRWWYPSYVKQRCPGLPDYRALADCASVFATPETGDRGRLLVYPEDWGGFDEERVANLGLDFEVVHAGSEAALLAEVKSAIQREAPILAWLYEPHWAPVVFDGEYVELPPYSDECLADESYACEKPKGPILKLSWNGAKDKWPHAWKIFESLTLDNQEYGAALIDISLNGKSVDEVVEDWMSKNKDRWAAWLQ